ncbi:DUF881 domain-containing protein [Georgenia muralis]|uniref:Uncharacterized protein YlxW (UPF0749 family) n=1 Tax=Georgenia muralis TaxID=154117 RepID=A0A3N4Z2G7_9MICO|nr:DUF881 domain-containing protein [Georgenia muralis]RPF26787.1 uncharacterized protein YlxW (UPF0749 family) [Georgenia muralis]
MEHHSDPPEPGAAELARPQRPHTARRPLPTLLRAGSVGTAAVAALAGLLFATGAQIFAGDSSRDAADITDLARDEAERLLELEEDNAGLRAAIQPYLDAEPAPTSEGGGAFLAALAAGSETAAGPGLRVELWDAPVDGQDSDIPPDALVVHQQDLEAVMNALWAGGAEAMAVQGHRVVSTTGVRCVGNVLHIQGRIYSPPFRVEAIGDPEQLRTSLLSAEGVQIYLQYVDAVGLGWSVEETGLELPAYSGSLSLRHAEVIEEGTA